MLKLKSKRSKNKHEKIQTNSNASNGSDTDATSGIKYGTLYNYYVASVGTISGSVNADDATNDICPAGWRLPTGGSSGEFKALYNQYNTSAKLRQSITNSGPAFALTGYFSNDVPKMQGSSGSYWSSTRADDTDMRVMAIWSSSVLSTNANYRNNGNPIRCIAK